ncbi:MAG: site-2 protease family protein [Clostridia bacterium]|nr:site-2 protease family protein [Clostridia bacterium]
MLRDITTIVLNVPAALIALSVHEFAHGYVSSKLGDPTPRAQGRLTLNPMAHLDPIGTLLMIFTGFGWAKPVQINPMYYKDRTKGMALTAAAGPVSNFIMAFIGMLIGVILACILSSAGVSGSVVSWILTFTSVFTQLNLCFMVFNLIPFPPLDGFKIFGMFMPRNVYYKILQYEHYIMYALMLLCLLGVFSSIIGTGVSFVYRLIYGAVMNIVGLFF